MEEKLTEKYGAALAARGQRMFSQFEGAEMVAEKYGLTREEMDSFAVKSHQRALSATKKGLFKKEIVPLMGKDKEGNDVLHDTDEGIRPNTNMTGLAKLKSLKSVASKGKESGIITAGLASQICDGAAALLICNEAGLKKLGVRPRAKIISLALAGTDPVMMLAGPIPATKTALKRVGLTIGDMDLYEVCPSRRLWFTSRCPTGGGGTLPRLGLLLSSS
jgi:acetyl-CoA C-acetyltransferase